MTFGNDSQRVESAERRAKEKIAEGARSEDTEITVCPNCHHGTLVTNTGQGDYCFYCQEALTKCTGCHDFVTEDETDEFGLCLTCSRKESMLAP